MYKSTRLDLELIFFTNSFAPHIECLLNGEMTEYVFVTLFTLNRYGYKEQLAKTKQALEEKRKELERIKER